MGKVTAYGTMTYKQYRVSGVGLKSLPDGNYRVGMSAGIDGAWEYQRNGRWHPVDNHSLLDRAHAKCRQP